MFELTSAAKDRMYKSLVGEISRLEDDTCFRLVRKGDEFLTLRLEKPQRGDATIEHYGQTILAIPKVLQSIFKDKKLDIGSDGKLKLS